MTRTPPKRSLPVLVPSQSEWQISQLVPGGAGFLRLANGQGAFAPGALPGERIRVLEAQDHRTYLLATRWSLLAASADRVAPACALQARCGGCDLMTLDYPAQLTAKLGILRDALMRTGRFEVLPEIPFVASDDQLAYRSRIRLHVDDHGQLGFFAADSHDLVAIPECPVAHADLNLALGELRSIVASQRTQLALFSEVELRVAPAGPKISLHLTAKDRRLIGGDRLISALSRSFQVSVAERAVIPDQDQRFPLPGGLVLRAPPAAFTQVNWTVNQRLVQAVVDGARARACVTFCDLYSGAGNFSLPLFAAGLAGVAIEASVLAIAAAERAAADHGFRTARFIAGDVHDVLTTLPHAEHFDLVLLDPPRSGARQILPELMRRAPRHIAYCACDPVTLARDLRTLCDGGYQLEQVTGFDMFPQTHHFETLVWLIRRAGGD